MSSEGKQQQSQAQQGQGQQGQSQFQSPSLYVGDLHPDVTEAVLFELFSQAGTVQSIRVCRDSITRRSLGYAYINYQSTMDAERALDTLNFTSINGQPCRVMWSHRDPSQRKSGQGNIFIKNLDESINNKALYDVFSSFGNILSAKVAMDQQGNSKGYGFVQFDSDEGAQKAIDKVNGMLLNDKKVFVGPFVPKKERQKNGERNFTNVYVKNVALAVTEEELEELFSKYGEITSLVIMQKKVKASVAQKLLEGKGNSEGEEDGEGEEEEEEGEEGKKEGEEGEKEEAGADDEEMVTVSRGFGFVNFKETSAARAAVDELDGFELKGQALTVTRAQKKSERQQELQKKFQQMREERLNRYQGVNVYVKNLDDAVDDQKLREEFAPFGTITSSKVMVDEKGNSKGFGFVCFSSAEEATKAVTDMNGKHIGQKPIYAALAQRKEVRRAQLEAQHAQRQNALRIQQQGNMQQQNQMYAQQAQMFYQQQAQQQMGPNGRLVYNVVPQFGRGQGQQGQQQGFVVPQQQQQAQQQQRQQRNPNQNVQRQQGGQQQGGQQQQGGEGDSMEALTITELTSASPAEQKDMLGDRLFPLVNDLEEIPDMDTAAKITGMLLEMDNFELLHLLEVPEALAAKVGEAQKVLQAHMQQQGGEQ